MEELEAEKRYLLALLTEKKKTEAALSACETEKDTWIRRKSLATEHGRDDLLAAAETELASLEARWRQLKGSILVQEKEIQQVRDSLKDLQIDDGRIYSREVTEAMVGQLQQAAGLAGDPDDPLAEDKASAAAETRATLGELSELEALQELEALRKKLKE